MKFFTSLLVVILLGAGIYFFFLRGSYDRVENTDEETNLEVGDEAEEEIVIEAEKDPVLGTSIEGRDIIAHYFGEGEDEIIFVGGIHGGYSWNTTLVMYELIDYLEESPEAIPENSSVTVIPVLNPDGLSKIIDNPSRFAREDVTLSLEETIPGRFNANNVDLNRNFNCDWQETGKWQNRNVSGGTKPFSEPESQAIKDYIDTNSPKAVVVYYSAAGGVFASSCHNGIMEETKTITNIYADASGYKAFEEFDFYSITGDMVNWLAGEEIPAISVLLSTHTDVEWDKNKKGIDALLEYYSSSDSE